MPVCSCCSLFGLDDLGIFFLILMVKFSGFSVILKRNKHMTSTRILSVIRGNMVENNLWDIIFFSWYI